MSDVVLATVADLAQRHGFTLDEQRITATIRPADVLGAALGMIQIQSEVEMVVGRTIARGQQSDNFRQMVRDVLDKEFKGNVQFDYHDASDKDRLYSIDAMIEGPGASLGIAIIPSSIEAERAVSAKMHMLAGTLPGEHGRRRHWIAIPRDVSALDKKTQLRLMKEYLVPVPKFDDGRNLIAPRILELAS